MATLPPGWAADYDGQRWFYCYTATSHTQYHFPKPGDEFPEFSLVDDHSKNDGLLPEEKLESERQVRKRAALRGTQGRTTNGKRSDEEGNDREMQNHKEIDEDEEHFCFESFGYLGPGSRSETMVSGHTMDGSAGKAAQRPPSSKLASVGIRTGTGDGECKAESSTPPISEPSIRNNANICGHNVGAIELPFLPARPYQPTAPPSDSSFIYNREITPSSAGIIAELVSESTALCEEEINPPPVELPSTGASWLEPTPLPDLVNQCPVEMPSVEDQTSKHSMTTDKDGKVDRSGRETNTSAGTDAVDANRSAWYTNWMSTSTEAEAPPRPPKAISRSNFSLRQGESPQLPSKASAEEILHQEILDFFPAVLPLPEATQIANDTARPAFSTMCGAETRHPSIPPSTLSHFPSVLRPGPRGSSQPPSTAAKLVSQNSDKPSSSQTPEAKLSLSVNEHKFKAFQPLRPQNMMTTTGKSNPPPPVMERHASAQVLNEVLAMPDPKDFVRGTALFPRSSEFPKVSSLH